MKANLLRITTTAAAGLFPALANAHPGHSAFDFTSGVPHPGHEAEVGILLVTATLVVLLLWAARSFFGRRD